MAKRRPKASQGNRGNVTRFKTFRWTGASDAYQAGYDAIDWGTPTPVAEEEHRGWAGYRLKRVLPGPVQETPEGYTQKAVLEYASLEPCINADANFKLDAPHVVWPPAYGDSDA